MDYEKEINEIMDINSIYIDEFTKWLEKKNLKSKTINNHVSNVELYLNDYLNYYEPTRMEQGVSRLNGFLGDWFIRKCMWSTAYSTKTTAASIKKFYQCMYELNYISEDDYKYLCEDIKENMEDWTREVEEYNNFDDLY